MTDTGATETVRSLEAIEYMLHQRSQRYGHEEVGVDPNKNKRFKFGNAQERWSESFLLLPQKVAGQPTSLGVYTLDVPGRFVKRLAKSRELFPSHLTCQ